MRSSKIVSLRKILALIGLVLFFFLLSWGPYQLITPNFPYADDFVEYWAAARLNLSQGNPYSPEQLLPLQKQAGWRAEESIMMWNPPWTLALVMPFGAFNYHFSRILWFLVQISCILFSSDQLWRFYGGPKQFRWLAWLVSFTFIPTIFALQKGQISPLLLFGVVVFLTQVSHQRWWLAGASLVFITIKPHSLYLLPIVFLVWALDQRRLSLLWAGMAWLATATLIVIAVNPAIISQYINALKTHPPFEYATPTLGAALRFVLGEEKIWLQFLPPLLGIVWFLGYWLRHRKTWRWAEQLPLLVLVSALTSAYGWTFDQVVLILVLIQLAVSLYEMGLGWPTVIVLGWYLVIEVAVLSMHGRYPEFWFVWLVPSMFGWYLTGRWLSGDRGLILFTRDMPVPANIIGNRKENDCEVQGDIRRK